MTIEVIREAILLCSLINLGLFLLAYTIIHFGHDFVYRIHGGWYRISEEAFDSIIYGSMTFYKILILFFNIIPYVVLRIIDS